MKGRTAWNEEMRHFLQTVPNIMATIDEFHNISTQGDVEQLERLVSSDRKLIGSRDRLGRTALHKAAQAGQVEVVEKLLNGDLSSAEDLARAKDKDLRTAAHYAARCDNAEARDKIFEILAKTGTNISALDSAGKNPEFYKENDFISSKPKPEENPDEEDPETEVKGLIEVNNFKDNGHPPESENPKTGYGVSDEEIERAVKDTDWEKMVELVLNGEGDRLMELNSEDEEVQEFLDNIRAFQEKILLINKAVESGSLRDLQNHLDRKKFALARDRSTGINFLQKAIILGHVDIVRYLASNFPKMLPLVDLEGRTSLHYASTVKDDGHLYKLLESCGSDEKAEDKHGHSPRFYLKNTDKLSLKTLQSNVERATFHSDPPQISLNEGLKSNAAKAKNWMGHLAHEIKSKGLQVNQINSFDEAYESSEYEEDGSKEDQVDNETLQRLTTAYRRLLWARDSQSLLKRFLTPKVYNRLQKRVSTEGGTLLDVVHSGAEILDTTIGVLAPDRDSYKVFWPLFKPIIASIHHVHEPNLHQPKLAWADAKKFGDLGSKLVHQVEFVAVRSLSEYPFGPILRAEEYREMEKDLKRAFDRMDGEFEGKYHPIKNMTEETERHLKDIDAFFDNGSQLKKAGRLYEEWPIGRGIFIAKNLIIQINESEHLKIIVRELNDRFRDAYELFLDVLEFFEDECLRSKFAYDSKLGFVTLSPEWLGTGLRVTITVELKRIPEKDLEEICSRFYLEREPAEEPDLNVKFWNKRTFGISENQLISDVFNGVKRIIEREIETTK
ncbi:hypothetical protein TCAL_09903 [Tigriopus californicus]|uniref:Uncharacterized protein n=1 Tax=Tigriopus californicus TaxID=6832 RepID=A0A553PNM9_TIGCA|nr:hypothetical protein TCAL_09903 [Tigriopus californicus]|eukprot:TCALIF_09903-PA protein Name:"Similar to Arginine kinase (Trypanosoma cruzi)" AED:0.12 eAED:0.13 QI:0/0.42/0.12/0.75/1/1/8/0/783